MCNEQRRLFCAISMSPKVGKLSIIHLQDLPVGNINFVRQQNQHSLDCLQVQFEHSPQRRQAKPSPSKGIIAMRALENKLECIYRVIYIYRALYKAEKYTEVNKRTVIYCGLCV